MTDKRVVPVEFVTKIKAEMPANTVIGNPEWWAERLYRWAIAAALKAERQRVAELTALCDAWSGDVRAAAAKLARIGALRKRNVTWILTVYGQHSGNYYISADELQAVPDKAGG